MKTIRVSMDDADFHKLHQRAKKSGLNSSALYLLSQAGFSANDSTKAATFVRKALKRAKKQPLNESFKVKDLLSAEWKGLSKGVRLRIGKQFREEVRSGKHKVKLAREILNKHHCCIIVGISGTAKRHSQRFYSSTMRIGMVFSLFGLPTTSLR